jgi:hypothetical protein
VSLKYDGHHEQMLVNHCGDHVLASVLNVALILGWTSHAFVERSLGDHRCCDLLLLLQLHDVLLDDDLIQLNVSIHGLCESLDPLQTFRLVKEALNLRALVRGEALVQLSVGNVKREVLNARGYELPSSKLLLDQYLCSDVLDALTLVL